MDGRIGHRRTTLTGLFIQTAAASFRLTRSRRSQRAGDQQAPFTYKGKTLEEMTKAEREVALTKGGLYASKVKVNGEMYYRKTRPSTLAGRNRVEYMAKANKETQDEFLAAEGADLFRREVERGLICRRRWPGCCAARMTKKCRVSEGLAAKRKR